MTKYDELRKVIIMKIKACYDALQTELDGRANYPTEEGETWSILTINRMIAQLDVLLDLLECPETGKGIYDFLEYYAEGYHLEEEMHDPHLEALKEVFENWLDGMKEGETS